MAWSTVRPQVSNPKADKFASEIKAAFLLDRVQDSEAFVGKLKPLFKECSELRGIPVNFRPEVSARQLAAVMSLVEIDAGSVVINEGHVTPDLYIVIKGALEARSSRSGSFRHGITFRPFEACGFVTLLTHVEWVTCTVKALEKTEVVWVPRKDLALFVMRIDHIRETADLMDFVTTTVPGAKYLGHAGKEKVLTYFQSCVFKKGDRLLRQGQVSDFAYILRSGECLKTSKAQRRISPVKGFNTKTTEHLALSLVTARQWLGEECLLYGQTLEYSAIATNQVTALRIHRTNFLEKLPKETLQALKAHFESKRSWKDQRQTRVKATLSQAVYGAEDNEYGQSGNGQTKHHPAASKAASLSLLKLQMRSESASPGRRPGSSAGISVGTGSRALSPSIHKQGEIVTPRPSTSLIRGESDSPNMSRVFSPEKSPFSLNAPSLKAVSFGYNTPVPRAARKSLSPMKVGTRSVREHFGYKDPEPPLEPESYLQQVIKPRPASPNPTEIWTKKYGIDRATLAYARADSPSKLTAGL